MMLYSTNLLNRIVFFILKCLFNLVIQYLVFCDGYLSDCLLLVWVYMCISALCEQFVKLPTEVQFFIFICKLLLRWSLKFRSKYLNPSHRVGFNSLVWWTRNNIKTEFSNVASNNGTTFYCRSVCWRRGHMYNN